MSKINVAIIGVGNCASSLIQGIYKYSELDDSSEINVPGVMNNSLGGYSLGDVNIVAAFDVDKEKVGKDLSEAIFSKNNNALKFHYVPVTGVVVNRGMTHDGIGEYLSDIVEVERDRDKPEGQTSDIVEILRERKVDVVINYLPVGSEEATKWYVEQVLAAGCGFVNCIPVFIAKEDGFESYYIDKIFESVWRDGLNMNDQNIVDKILKNANINPKTFFLRASGQSIKNTLRKKTDEAFEKGVFGAPTFLVNNKIFWGQDRLDYAIAEAKK